MMMLPLAHAAIIFDHYYQHAKEIPWNDKWHNDEEHFGNIFIGQDAPVLSKNEKARSVNDNGYRILMIGTGGANVVICEGFYKVRNTFYAIAHPTMRALTENTGMPLNVSGIEILLDRIDKGTRNDSTF